jgi:ribosomal protein S18 acetylase RimI-like enzyme
MGSDDEYRLRQLRPEDADAVAALIRAAFADLPVVPDPPPSALRETAAGVIERLQAGGGAGAEALGALVGAILWVPADDGLYVSRVSVQSDWRRRGIAQALLARAEDAATQAGLPRLWLSVRLALPGNRRLFAAAGYVETERHAHPGYSMPTFVDMERRLAGGEMKTPIRKDDSEKPAAAG